MTIDLKKEIRYFFTALMFFTRIPCPPSTDHSEEYLNKSRKYFPLIGWIVGGVAALTFWASSFVFSTPISIVLSIIASVWTTGAFHEDGFTDVCDAFGGGWTKAQILTIMKDSRIGAYGVVGLALLLLLKFLSLVEIANNGSKALIISLICAHALSRFVASTFVHTHDYVQDLDVSKSRPIANSRLSWSEMAYSFLFAITPFLLFQNYWALAAFPVAYLSKIYLGYYFKKHIGGYTGDCLGATQQVSEVLIYLTLGSLWKFM
jgi:adenosylcobinamide-GDP ribazoletransferase